MVSRVMRAAGRRLRLALLVAVGALAGLSPGAAAITWTAHPLPSVGTTIGQLNDVIFDGGKFWAVGANGWVQTSTDGAAWTSVGPGPTYFFYDIAHGGGNQYVVVGANSPAGGTVYVTNDGGATWTQATSGVPSFFSLFSVAHGPNPGEYVAVGAGGTVVRSTDGGVTWAAATGGPQSFSPPSYNDLNSVLYAAGKYVAVGGNGAILTSADGNAWVAQTSGTSVVLENVAYANGLFVAVGWNGTVLTSPDAVTWTPAASVPTTKNLAAVTYGPCGWVAVGVGATVLRSSDGQTWTAESSGTGATLVGAAYGNGRYVAVGQGTTLVGECSGRDGQVSVGTEPVPVGGKCAPLPGGAVAWWPLDEAAGATSVTDVVGGNTGTPVSGPVGSGGPVPTAGKVGGAFQILNQSTYVRVPNHPALNFGTGDFTVDAWVNPVQVAPQFFQPIVDKVQAAGAPGAVQGYRLYIKNGRLIFAVSDGATQQLVATPVAYGTWQFVAAERAGNALNLYVNGGLAATAALPAGYGSVSNTADLLVGGLVNVATPVQAPIGEIALDEVELFKRALTAQEIQGIFAAGPKGKCPTTPPPAGKPDLTVAKKPTGPLVAGQQGSYQIVVSNAGQAAAQGPIVVTDTLGAGLTYVSASGTGWTCSASGATVTCTHPGPVPAGGSLPPVTLTVQVAPDAKEVKNCARVKAVEQPPSPGMPKEVLLPDADPTNNEACDVSPVVPGDQKTGKICGVKFLDHDGDGTWDANEPGLPNWTIQVKDAAGNPVGSAVTGPKGRFCIKVKPGTYTVSEVIQPGWVQTAPQPVPPGTATVTVADGQTAVVQFGNRPEKEPCCLNFTWQGGKADQFSTADGATAEPAAPPPGQPQAYFDETKADQWFRYRFILPEGQCLREAKLELLVRPLDRMPVWVSSSRNDTIALYAGSGVWGAKFGPSGPAAVTNQLSATEWVLDNWPGGMTLTLDLASLPGGGNLLASLDAARTLDIVLQDDTSVDYARLVVRFCDCAEKEKEALGAAARGGAGEIILPLRKVCNPKDDDCNGWVEKAGAPHDASVSIVRNIPGRRIMLADGAPRPLDAQPVIRGGRTFLPVRALAEALGLDVAWDANEKKVTLTGDERVVALWVGKPKAALREFVRNLRTGQVANRTQGPGSEGGNTAPDPNRIITIEGTKDPCLPSNPGDPYPGGPLCDPPSLIEIDRANPDVVPFIENGRVMLPLRFIAEALDLDVSFEPQTQQVTIKQPSPECIVERAKSGSCIPPSK